MYEGWLKSNVNFLLILALTGNTGETIFTENIGPFALPVQCAEKLIRIYKFLNDATNRNVFWRGANVNLTCKVRVNSYQLNSL